MKKVVLLIDDDPDDQELFVYGLSEFDKTIKVE